MKFRVSMGKKDLTIKENREAQHSPQEETIVFLAKDHQACYSLPFKLNPTSTD